MHNATPCCKAHKSIFIAHFYNTDLHINLQGDPKEGVPGQPIGVNEYGTTVEVTFEEEPGEEPEIGTIKTKACYSNTF